MKFYLVGLFEFHGVRPMTSLVIPKVVFYHCKEACACRFGKCPQDKVMESITNVYRSVEIVILRDVDK